MKIHPLITTSAELAALVDRLAQHPFVAVDTEFMRENTYWPELCLIQVASPDEAAAIDPKADLDLKPLLDLLVENHDVLKVFHAGGQDLEIVHNLTGKTPVPLFDTQVAAMALGHGEQVGYSNLIESMLGHSLDKGARFTDWGRRPLDKRQIDYAIADVTHLANIFPRLVEKLKKTGRGAWLDEEMERLADPSSFAFEPEDAWKRLRDAEPQPRRARPPEGDRRLARDRGAVEEPAARANRQGRDAGRARRPPAQDPGRPRQDPRAFGRLEEQRHRPAADAGDRERPSRSRPTKCPTASRAGPA